MSMQTQPSPEKRAQAAARKTGALKRDINLLPANELSSKMARRGTIALGVVVALLVAAYFAILTPALALQSLQDQAAAAENQAALLQPAEADALAKQAERDKKTQILAYVNDTAGYRHPADIMAELERACPNTILLSSFNLDASGMTIGGFAGNDGEIVEFMVNLRAAFPQYDAISLVSAKDAEEDSKIGMKRQFEVAAKPALTEAPMDTAAPAGDAEGGDAQ
jgi:Tfp pilus assembly protein PilN